ncbi:hypothetical protein [Salinisphaera hydrothermalis]|uniref:hypothetical protein n=1 Tax=Salinisphaera hydrothermalis TaxID=563188 RepID=UPI0012EB9FD3|nr:hypothetical protein [Salinisphaera hydrothermalis]
MKSNYPTPKPDQRNANYNHGTKPNPTRGARGTMGNKNQGAKGGAKLDSDGDMN